MSIIRTDKWLLDSYDKPIEICEKLKVHFEGATFGSEIYDYLTLHGMYRPFKNGKKIVAKLQENKVWDIVENDIQKLQQLWQGPNVPVFIIPSDTNNLNLKREFNGKSGLAFKDKLFLFISEDNKETEIRSLFTHEYNHVCRLTIYQKPEDNYVLLDTIILEGLAENAVLERFGDKSVSTWASFYSNSQLEKMWKELVYPNRNITKSNHKHNDILYGLNYYPKMSGYCVGYYLVKKYLEVNQLTCKDLLNTEPDDIANLSV